MLAWFNSNKIPIVAVSYPWSIILHLNRGFITSAVYFLYTTDKIVT